MYLLCPCLLSLQIGEQYFEIHLTAGRYLLKVNALSLNFLACVCLKMKKKVKQNSDIG